MNYECLLWKEIQDIIGLVSFWPQSVRRYFWMPYLSHWQRIITATFIAVNALNPEVYYDWCELKSFFCRGSRMHQHFQQLFAYFRQGRHSLCSWHVLNRRFQSIGPIRYSFLYLQYAGLFFCSIFFIWNEPGVLNITSFGYSLHKFSGTILH